MSACTVSYNLIVDPAVGKYVNPVMLRTTFGLYLTGRCEWFSP